MKINWAYLKKPSVLIGAVILFFVLLFMLNKSGGASSSGTTTVTQTGPTDAQVAAQTQLALAQIGAGVQGQAIAVDYAKSQDSNATALALAQVQAALSGQSLVVQKSIADETIAAQVHGLDLQYQTAVANNNFALNYAKNQFDYGLASQAINANVTIQLSQQQLDAYKFGTTAQLQQFAIGTAAQVQEYNIGALTNLASTLKTGKRDNAFNELTTMTYNPSAAIPGVGWNL